MNAYRLISSDSHVVEPRDLWEAWIEPAFRERAPHVVREEARDQWIADGDVPIGTFGSVGQAGVRFEDRTQITHYGRAEDIPPGGRDPHAHARDLDRDGVHADVIYPSVTLTAYMLPAGDLVSAIFRAYNNWLAEFCRAYPGRLNGVAVLNVDNVDEAIDELERTAKLGLVGACIPSAAGTVRYHDPSYEPLWAAAQDLGVPLSLHVFSNRWKPGMPAGVLMKKETAFHGSVDDYRRHMGKLGFPEETAGFEQAWGRSDPAAASEHVSDAMLETLSVAAGFDEIPRRVAAFREAGVDYPILYPFPTGLHNWSPGTIPFIEKEYVQSVLAAIEAAT